MVKVYLYSIILYMFIILCAIYLCEDNIEKNGWNKSVKSDINPWLILLCVSAVPIFRIAFVVFTFYMAYYTFEQFEAWKAKIDKKYKELRNDKDE